VERPGAPTGHLAGEGPDPESCPSQDLQKVSSGTKSHRKGEFPLSVGVAARGSVGVERRNVNAPDCTSHAPRYVYEIRKLFAYCSGVTEGPSPAKCNFWGSFDFNRIDLDSDCLGMIRSPPILFAALFVSAPLESHDGSHFFPPQTRPLRGF
jgi:hypothetical protein